MIGVAFGLGWVVLLATVDLTAGHRFAFGFAFTVAFGLVIGEIVAAIRRACR